MARSARASPESRDGLFDRVFDPLQLDLVVVDDRVGRRGSPSRGWPTLPGLSTTTPSTSRLNCMCEWPTQTTSASTFWSRLAQVVRVLHQVFVERVAGRGVDQQEPLAVEREPLGQRELEQIAALVGPERLPHRAGG